MFCLRKADDVRELYTWNVFAIIVSLSDLMDDLGLVAVDHVHNLHRPVGQVKGVVSGEYGTIKLD